VARKVRIAVDGSVLVNPDGPGGWAVVFDDGRTLAGSDPSTTNNRMEMRAVIEGLRAIEGPSEIIVECDSRYVCRGVSTWVEGWRKRGWRNAQGKRVKNREVWEELMAEVERHVSVEMVWIRGHDGHPANEEADRLAGEAARSAAPDTLAIGAIPAFIPEAIAREFHEAYERLAPDHGYETRVESAVPWEDVPEDDRGLMCAVVEELLERGVIVRGS